MSEPCSDLVRFADGELDPERAQAFRSHLPTCPACQTGLLEAIQLDARLSTLAPPANLVSEAPTEAPPAEPARPAEPAGRPELDKPKPSPRPKPSHRIAAWGAVAFAPTAAVAVYLFHQGPPPNVFAELKTRPYDIRLAYVAAALYRPTREPMRGERRTQIAAQSSETSVAPSERAGVPPSESIPYAALAAFEQNKDRHALAIARAFNGDKLTDVATQLRALPQTPSIRSDRAALELLTTNRDNVEPILTELEALKTSHDPVVARAARWNYAIELARLDLPLSAADAFRAIAGEREPGWADEARGRAEPADQRAKDFQAQFERARQAGKALVAAGTPVPIELVRGNPGLLRGYFYDAVRAAPSRERVLALAEMAGELDRLGGPQEPHVLGDYVARVAGGDFRNRAPLAGAYARLLQGATLTADEERALTTAGAASDVVDIVMGAMSQLGVVPAHLEAFRRMAKQSGDPWFEIALARAEATSLVQHGNWFGAEAGLRAAENLCGRGDRRLSVPCLSLAYQLGKLYEDLHRIPESLKVLRAAVDSARSLRDWSQYSMLLYRLADVERFHSSTATARAYANEVLRLVDNREFKSLGHLLLAGAAVLDVDGRRARREFEEALRDGIPDLEAANLLADIGRLDPQPGDLALLQGWLRDLRGSANTTAAQRVLADEIEGRLVIERDGPAGRALLERAIAAADALPHEVTADKACAGAYSVLAFDAARHDDSARVLTLIARDLGHSPPSTCAVGMLAEDERAVVVVRGADGRDRATYDAKRDPRGASLTVSGDLGQELAACAHVQVMAPAALQGQPQVLPAKLPWSYAAGMRGRTLPGNPPGGARPLIVTDVTPPAYLQLPQLQGQPPDPSATRLSGPDATPARVLAEMIDAREIQFHTHALMDVGVSDASHLVLSPDSNGNYALTAESIRSIELRGHPIVVLAACHSAQGARYQHAPWSLPDAFLAVGARAVFAVATDVPDSQAGPFFTRVLARVRAGADPAIALRDERMTALAATPSSWIGHVILFE